MQIEYYAFALVRVAVVVGIIAAQAWLAFTIGIEEGVIKALFYQCVLQAIAALVAPRGLRFTAAIAAGWASAILAAALALTWATGIIPISAMIGFMRFGDYSSLLVLFSLTAYLAIPYGIACCALALDE